MNKDGVTTVHFETPDAVYCFKTLDVNISGYAIVGRVGYTDDEVSTLMQFCINNASSLLECAKMGA